MQEDPSPIFTHRVAVCFLTHNFNALAELVLSLKNSGEARIEPLDLVELISQNNKF